MALKCPKCESTATFLTLIFPSFSVENVADLVCTACNKMSFAHREIDGTVTVSETIEDEWITEEE